jgi:hypothetical protein
LRQFFQAQRFQFGGIIHIAIARKASSHGQAETESNAQIRPE